MEEDETFDSFYVRFSNIVNTLCNLHHPIKDVMQVEKVLSSLSTRLSEKVTIIETAHTIEDLNIGDI